MKTSAPGRGLDSWIGGMHRPESLIKHGSIVDVAFWQADGCGQSRLWEGRSTHSETAMQATCVSGRRARHNLRGRQCRDLIDHAHSSDVYSATGCEGGRGNRRAAQGRQRGVQGTSFRDPAWQATLDGAWQQLEAIFNRLTHHPGQLRWLLVIFSRYARGQLARPAIHASWCGMWNAQTWVAFSASKSGRWWEMLCCSAGLRSCSKLSGSSPHRGPRVALCHLIRRWEGIVQLYAANAEGVPVGGWEAGGAAGESEPLLCAARWRAA